MPQQRKPSNIWPEVRRSTRGMELNRGHEPCKENDERTFEEHEGTISARSSPGEGTIFTIRLPVDNATVFDASHTHGPAR